MASFEDKPPPAVGAFWIKEEDYPALLKIFDDGDKLPPSWKEWLRIAEEMEQGLKAYGHVVLRVPIDPATFPDWCTATACARAVPDAESSSRRRSPSDTATKPDRSGARQPRLSADAARSLASFFR